MFRKLKNVYVELFNLTFLKIYVSFFGFLRRKQKEPSTATKIAFGLLITALSSQVINAFPMNSSIDSQVTEIQKKMIAPVKIFSIEDKI